MRARFSRLDFIKLSAAAFGGLAFLPYDHWLTQFDDANLVRVASSSVNVYSEPDDKCRIVAQWYRDELLPIYAEVNAGAPAYNPVWYRVWGGYVHRGRLQKVKTLLNEQLRSQKMRDISRIVHCLCTVIHSLSTEGCDSVKQEGAGPWWRV